MQPFTTLTGVAAPLPLINVDTDKIIPARHLKTIKRTGLGVHLLETLRYDEERQASAPTSSSTASPTATPRS